MDIFTATFIVSVNEKLLPFLTLIKGNLDKSGVRYELFIISNLETQYDFSDLKPKMVLKANPEKLETEILNEFLLSISSSSIFEAAVQVALPGRSGDPGFCFTTSSRFEGPHCAAACHSPHSACVLGRPDYPTPPQHRAA